MSPRPTLLANSTIFWFISRRTAFSTWMTSKPIFVSASPTARESFTAFWRCGKILVVVVADDERDAMHVVARESAARRQEEERPSGAVATSTGVVRRRRDRGGRRPRRRLLPAVRRSRRRIGEARERLLDGAAGGIGIVGPRRWRCAAAARRRHWRRYPIAPIRCGCGSARTPTPAPGSARRLAAGNS